MRITEYRTTLLVRANDRRVPTGSAQSRPRFAVAVMAHLSDVLADALREGRAILETSE